MAGLEPELESILHDRLARGTVTLSVRYQDHSTLAAAAINQDALKSYVDQLSSIAGVSFDAAALLQLPGVLVQATPESRRRDDLAVLARLTTEACEAVVAMRNEEGVSLRRDLELHLERISTALEVVEERVPEVNRLFSDRLRSRMQSMLSELAVDVREEDVLREVAIFSEKSDIAEEIARLRGHLAQFSEILDDDGASPVGRTLDFLTQEMLREANTMGSKCLDPTVSRHVVSIKGAVDRVKEQVQNVE